MSQYATVGEDEDATFGAVHEDGSDFILRLFWFPNNVINRISPNEPVRLVFKATSDTTESKSLTIEIAWDGKWHEGRSEMSEHLIIKVI